MKLHEMDGFLKGKCLPGDMLVNETHAEYLVRKFAELQSALDVQSARSDALAAENAAIKTMNDCMSEELRSYESDGAFEGPKMHLLWWRMETPATDAWVNEQRAIGVDSAIESAKKEIASEFQYQSFDNCISACARHPQSDLSGKVEMVAWLEWFAAQIRGSQV